MSFLSGVLATVLAIIGGVTAFFSPHQPSGVENNAPLANEERAELERLREQVTVATTTSTPPKDEENVSDEVGIVADSGNSLSVAEPSKKSISPIMTYSTDSTSVASPKVSPTDPREIARSQLAAIEDFLSVYKEDLLTLETTFQTDMDQGLENFSDGSYMTAIYAFDRADLSLAKIQAENQANAIPTSLGEDTQAEMMLVRNTNAELTSLRRQRVLLNKDLAAAASSGYLDSNSLRERENELVRLQKKIDVAVSSTLTAYSDLLRTRQIVELLTK